MKKIILLIPFFLTLFFISSGQTGQKIKKGTASKNQEPSDLRLIIQLEKDFFKAKLENNVTFMEEILSNDLISTNQFGNVKNKSAFITLWRTFKIRTYTLDSIGVNLVNDSTAIVTGLHTENGNQMKLTHNLVKQKGKWQITRMLSEFPEFESLRGMGSYRITGYLKDAEGVAVSLMARGRVNLNAAIVKDGKFIMEGKPVVYPDMVFLTTPAKREQASFFLENSEITITGSLDSLSKVKVTGSKTQDDYYSFLSRLDPIQAKTKSMIQDLRSADPNPDSATISRYRKAMEEFNQQQHEIEKEFIKSNSRSYVVPVIFDNLFSSLAMEENKSIIKSLDPGVAKTQIMLSIMERVIALEAVEIGKKAPDFTLNDVNGIPVSLYSKIGPKLLLIDFWAAWCSPCRRENPNLVNVYNNFREKGFEILGVSLDRTREEWIKAIEKDKLPWTHVSDLLYFNSAAAKIYSVTAIPANFLLDKNGIIIAKNLRGDDLFNKVKELLKE